jgi:hypothetical protein
MEFLTGIVAETQQSAMKDVQDLVAEQGIKERILQELQQHAQAIANHINDPTAPDPATFDPVPIAEEQKVEYQLVLEYLESLGLKFAPTVLRYESQHPQELMPRQQLAESLGLKAFDRTPLLIQMIEAKQKYATASK